MFISYTRMQVGHCFGAVPRFMCSSACTRTDTLGGIVTYNNSIDLARSGDGGIISTRETPGSFSVDDPVKVLSELESLIQAQVLF